MSISEIKPDGIYTPADVYQMLDIQTDAQERERAAGRLKYRTVQGSTAIFNKTLYRGQDLIEWFNSLDSGTVPRQRSTSTAVPIPRPAERRAAVPPSSTATAGSAIDRFNAAVASKKKTGMSEQAATSAVTRENPALHRQMLTEANAHRPAAVKRMAK